MQLPENTVLLVIDVQQAFDNPRWGQRNNPDAETQIANLIAAWRDAAYPIVHIQHRNPSPESLFQPESLGIRVKPEAQPLSGEPVLFKCVNSAFIGTDLKRRLEAMNAPALVIVGITTDHCVSTTARMAGNFGFKTYVVSDATCTHERTGTDGHYYTADEMHGTALASLQDEFATIVSTAEVLKALPLKETLRVQPDAATGR